MCLSYPPAPEKNKCEQPFVGNFVTKALLCSYKCCHLSLPFIHEESQAAVQHLSQVPHVHQGDSGVDPTPFSPPAAIPHVGGGGGEVRWITAPD